MIDWFDLIWFLTATKLCIDPDKLGLDAGDQLSVVSFLVLYPLYSIHWSAAFYKSWCWLQIFPTTYTISITEENAAQMNGRTHLLRHVAPLSHESWDNTNGCSRK